MPYKKMRKFPSALEKKTIELYAALPRNISDVQIAEATELSSSWISQFVKGKSGFPDAGRVEALYAYCNGSPLKL